MNNFIIVALPRSRTAWLSVMMSTAKTRCFHDLVGEIPTSGIGAYMKAQPFDAMGICDTAVALVLPKVMEQMPNARVVYIERPVDECIVSLSRAGNLSIDRCARIIRFMHAKIQDHKRVYRGPQFGFTSVDAKSAIEGIWDHCTDGMPFSETRYDEIRKLHIQVLPSILRNPGNPELTLKNIGS